MESRDMLNSHQIYHGIMTGAEKIIENSDLLNESNGFPVPDRDTGNNLSYLMEYIGRQAKKSNNINEMMGSVSNAAIIGARGNSGAIFSQFFTGFENQSPRGESMDSETLVSCFKSGYEYAYHAIKNPVEGTILTAMRSFADSFELLLKREADLRQAIDGAFKTLVDTVKETKYTLKAQSKLHAEDAGAIAFLYFIEGFLEIIMSDRIITDKSYADLGRNLEVSVDFEHSFDTDLAYRFCTEVLVKKKNSFNRTELEGFIEPLGDSLVVSENKELLRIHVHTDEPKEVVKKMSSYGSILEAKADDMEMQYSLSRKHPDEIALVIDTIADLPDEEFPDFVYQLPMTLMADKVSYQDKRTVYPELLDKKRISSSQLNREQVRTFLEPIIKRHKHVVILTVSSKMSGLYERYEEVIHSDPDKVTLIDTKLNSVAQGLVAHRAIELMSQTKDLKVIKEEIESAISRTKIYVSILNLDGMVNSGRLSERIGWILKKSGFLPLITINKEGEGTVEGLAFNRKQNEKLFYKKAASIKDKIESYALVHAYAPERVHEAAEKLTEILGKPPQYIEGISSVVINFAGIGSIAIGYTLKE